MNHLSRSVSETARVATDVLKTLLPKKRADAPTLALYGDLGSGKTAFVQELGKLLGVKEVMQSPTFVIMKPYDISYSRFRRLIHIDLYRIEHPEELANLGWAEILKDPKNLVIVEWAERAEQLLPKDAVKIHFTFINETTREISVLE